MRSNDITVVKLGGSHAGSAHLSRWLGVLAACGGHVVLVPGGGPFADAVRKAQPKMGFDQAAAHHMALLAMEQYGRALVSLRPGLRLAGSIAAIRRVLRDGHVPIWAPTAMVLRAAYIPASWDITSDSLAAWLAGRIGARRLLLIKQGGTFEGVVGAARLASSNVVDKAFPRFLSRSGVQAAIIPASEHGAGAVQALRTGADIGAHIDLQPRDALLSRPWPKSKHRAGAGR